MFASIAHRYDLLNHLLSLSVDRHWRRTAVKKLLPLLPERPLVLDLCTGTGDLALALSAAASVVGCDFCHPMLVLGRKKARSHGHGESLPMVEGDALKLPFRRSCFDAVTVAFGLRNLSNYGQGLNEMFRVLRPGASLLVVEFSQPRIPVFRHIYKTYFLHVLPRVGQLISGQRGPYSYLPRSVSDFPGAGQLAEMMREAGFSVQKQESLTCGIVTLHLAKKPASD